MFFSAKELLEYSKRNPSYMLLVQTGAVDRWGQDYNNGRPLTTREAKACIKRMRKAIVARSFDNSDYRFVAKWLRPWHVVPKLSKFKAPRGDYGVGVEIEMGFTSRENASYIANLIKDWKYVAVDTEGGQYPIEATFPPVPLSKFNNSQAIRYTKLLKENQERVYPHLTSACVGTHVNVSLGRGAGRIVGSRYGDMHSALGVICHGFSWTDQTSENADFCSKYFGRPRPYGTIYNQRKYFEFKLFNSTTSTKELKKYVAVAVELVKFMQGSEPITVESVKNHLTNTIKL